MKFFKNFLALLVAVLMIIACQKEAIEETVDLSSREGILAYFADDIDAYVKEHNNLEIEYTSLEEVNETFESYGLEPVTLESIGITDEEYIAAQNRINNPDIANSRCTGNLAVYFGDNYLNMNNRLDRDDVARFKIGLNGTREPFIRTQDYFEFGYFSIIWGFNEGIPNPSPNTNDGVVALQIILGIRPCM